MKCLIRQPAGLGDIIFCQKIAKTLVDSGYDIIWPLAKHYSYLKDYITHPNISFVIESDDFLYKDIYQNDGFNFVQTDDFLYLPLQRISHLMFENEKSMMIAKYKYCQMDYHDWTNYVSFSRNKEREDYIKNFLGIKHGEKYNFINNLYGTPPHTAKNENIIPKNDFKNVYLNIYDWDHVFDWLGVIEQAEEIHTVETSLCYLMKCIGLKNVSIYERVPEKNLRYDNPSKNYLHQPIFSDDWKYYIQITKDGFNR
jgi:hypothetical protein